MEKSAENGRVGSGAVRAIKTRNSREPEEKKAGSVGGYGPLKTTFRSRGFDYRQIAREGDFAVYEQKWRKSENVCFEVIRIQRAEAMTFPGGKRYPAREVYPWSSLWGDHGWTVLSLDAARAKLRALLNCR